MKSICKQEVVCPDKTTPKSAHLENQLEYWFLLLLTDLIFVISAKNMFPLIFASYMSHSMHNALCFLDVFTTGSTVKYQSFL